MSRHYINSKTPDVATTNQFRVERPVYTESEFSSQWTLSTPETPTVAERLTGCCKSKCACSAKCVKESIYSLLPCIPTMRNYKWKQDIIGDLVAGITVGIVQIPQGLAYGLLAAVEPVFGLYSAFFPVLIYFFFGTSHHISMGTYAITSLMVGSVVDKYNCTGGGGSDGGDAASLVSASLDDGNDTTSVPGTPDDPTFTDEALCKIGIAATITVYAGALQLAMGILRLGWLTIYLSEPLTRGYTTASALYVMTSQLKYLFGLKLTRYSGPLNFFKTYIELIPILDESNVSSVVISAVAILMLAVFKEHLQPRFKKKFKVPFPIELLVVILATVVSHFGKFQYGYGTDVVGNIPKGIPSPSVPTRISEIETLLPAAVSIAIVGYANSMSLAKLFAKKHGYKVDATQELIAHGLSNGVSSFFNCIFGAPSMSRTLVHEGAGAVTQLAGVISCILVLLVLLFIGPLFEALPKAVLGSIIVVALKGMFMQFQDLKKLWKVDKIDLSIWLVTFIATMLLDVDVGLLVGVGYNLLTVVYRTQRAHSALLGQIPDTDIYRNIKKFNDATEISGIKAFRFEAPLHYANRERFEEELVHRIGFDPATIKILRKKQLKKQQKAEKAMANGDAKHNDLKKRVHETSEKALLLACSAEVHSLIIDCSVISYIDSMGVSCLIQVIKDFKEIGIHVYLARLRSPARHTLAESDFYDKVPDDVVYVSVHDAVIAALQRHEQNGLHRQNGHQEQNGHHQPVYENAESATSYI